MHAVQVPRANASFELVTVAVPVPKTNEVLIHVEACGICHGDALALEGKWPGIKYPLIPGHEIVGTVQARGSAVTRWAIGQRIGVGWHGGHCFHCQNCMSGDTWNCEQTETTGLTVNGGYADFCVARDEACFSIPSSFSSTEAAPLLCAGNTVLGALKNSKVQAGDLVAVVGIGGLGHLAVQFAKKMGLRTVAISRGLDKKQLALELGAHLYLDSTDVKACVATLQKMGGAKFILCTAPNHELISSLFPALAKDGKMTIVSGSNGAVTIPQWLFLGGMRSVQGWVGGNVNDALALAELVQIKPMVEVFPLSKVQEAYERMMNAKVKFRVVLVPDSDKSLWVG